MAALTTWYNSQYSTWNRTRRLQAQPYLARTDTIASRRATEMAQAQEAVVLNMGDPASTEAKDKKSDTLFGPNIGIVSGGPEWTERREKSEDELTPDIIKSWISKAKAGNQTTTTLQALVNLKRPTLRLTPLEIAPADDPEHADSQHHHGLEFEYDCDAPKCGISVQVLLHPKHRLAGKPDVNGLCKLLVFESVVEGGFGKVLKLEDGATLELGRFEYHPDVSGKDATADTAAIPEVESAAEDNHVKGRSRFTHFNFRKRSHQRAAAGPALTVMDVDVQAVPGDHGEVKAEKDEEADAGVRVTIRLAALDNEGHELPSVNEQVTYLHIVRFGAPPAPVNGEPVEDKRPWVVKVVKREATIGPHTFQLHEIYGLSANSTTAAHAVEPTSPAAPEHVYPPVPAPNVTHEDEPSSECLLCLSSPREVVLLPCRHLVACRECALNMIEFGAGGTIVHQDEPTTTTTATDVVGEAAGPAAPDAVPPSVETPAPALAPRRKRKAKGWFCPVCRQPYTSMLRITTSPPEKDDKNRESMSTEIHIDTLPAAPASPTSPTRVAGFTSLGVPGFLRFGRPGAPAQDLESGQA